MIWNLFPIFSGLIKPSLRNFRISLSNGLFSAVGIGESIPSLRTVLESFLPHTARQINSFFWCSILLFIFLELTKRNEINYMSFKLEL
ncbi:hypothetical protein RIF29_43179 [Crotalaria pallida]|uniref:Uncharacterized protein n=1 Tax=Crotalaria pallida TaxID=3830 RepID=A0AAN9DX93_CROPI